MPGGPPGAFSPPVTIPGGDVTNPKAVKSAAFDGVVTGAVQSAAAAKAGVVAAVTGALQHVVQTKEARASPCALAAGLWVQPWVAWCGRLRAPRRAGRAALASWMTANAGSRGHKSSVVPFCSAGADNRNGAAWQEGPRLHSARYLALCAGIKLMQGVRAPQEECFYKFQHCAKCNSKKNKCMACNAPFAVTPQGHCVCPIGWQAATNQFGETTCLSPGITQLEPYVQNISSQITNLTTVVQTITQVPPASALQCVCRHTEATCAARSGPEVPKGGRAPRALYRLVAHVASACLDSACKLTCALPLLHVRHLPARPSGHLTNAVLAVNSGNHAAALLPCIHWKSLCVSPATVLRQRAPRRRMQRPHPASAPTPTAWSAPCRASAPSARRCAVALHNKNAHYCDDCHQTGLLERTPHARVRRAGLCDRQVRQVHLRPHQCGPRLLLLRHSGHLRPAADRRAGADRVPGGHPVFPSVRWAVHCMLGARCPRVTMRRSQNWSPEPRADTRRMWSSTCLF